MKKEYMYETKEISTMLAEGMILEVEAEAEAEVEFEENYIFNSCTGDWEHIEVYDDEQEKRSLKIGKELTRALNTLN